MIEYEEAQRRFKKDVDFFELHQQELLQQYPDEWVAIYDGHVVGANPDAERLLQDLVVGGIPIDKAWIQYLSTKEDLLILVR